MKMNTKPKHFRWFYVALSLAQGGVTFGDGYQTPITKFLLSALWNPGDKGSAAAPFWLVI